MTVERNRSTKGNEMHTPGPWIWADQKRGLYGAGPHNAVLEWYQYEGMHLSGITEDTQEANACLIAAAPELLNALKAISRHIDCPENYDSHINKLCDDAISKAEGLA